MTFSTLFQINSFLPIGVLPADGRLRQQAGADRPARWPDDAAPICGGCPALGQGDIGTLAPGGFLIPVDVRRQDGNAVGSTTDLKKLVRSSVRSRCDAICEINGRINAIRFAYRTFVERKLEKFVEIVNRWSICKSVYDKHSLLDKQNYFLIFKLTHEKKRVCASINLSKQSEGNATAI